MTQTKHVSWIDCGFWERITSLACAFTKLCRCMTGGACMRREISGVVFTRSSYAAWWDLVLVSKAGVLKVCFNTPGVLRLDVGGVQQCWKVQSKSRLKFSLLKTWMWCSLCIDFFPHYFWEYSLPFLCLFLALFVVKFLLKRGILNPDWPKIDWGLLRR